MAEEGTQDQVTIDTDQDRYPNIYDVLAVLQDEADLPNGPVERLEIGCLANGEAVYRVWYPRAEDPEIGHFAQI